MPEPPETGLLTRFVLENPWPGGIVLLAAGVILGWLAIRDGRTRRLLAAGVLLLAGAAVLVVGALVRTAGEQAQAVTRQFVDRAVAADVYGAGGLLALDASLSLGAATNPGVDRDAIDRRMQWLADRYTIESNQITLLQGYTISDRQAEVHLACRTDAGRGPVTTRWVLRVERMDDGSWKIRRLALISVNGQPPPRLRW